MWTALQHDGSDHLGLWVEGSRWEEPLDLPAAVAAVLQAVQVPLPLPLPAAPKHTTLCVEALGARV